MTSASDIFTGVTRRKKSRAGSPFARWVSDFQPTQGVAVGSQGVAVGSQGVALGFMRTPLWGWDWGDSLALGLVNSDDVSADPGRCRGLF